MTRTDMICKLLQIARDDDNSPAKFKILYKPYLSFTQLQYLKIMTESDLLRYEPESQRYRITENGHRFLEIYNEV